MPINNFWALSLHFSRLMRSSVLMQLLVPQRYMGPESIYCSILLTEKLLSCFVDFFKHSINNTSLNSLANLTSVDYLSLKVSPLIIQNASSNISNISKFHLCCIGQQTSPGKIPRLSDINLFSVSESIIQGLNVLIDLNL